MSGITPRGESAPRSTAEIIGSKLGLPVALIAPEAGALWLARAVLRARPAAVERAHPRAHRLVEPANPSLVEDVEPGHYTD